MRVLVADDEIHILSDYRAGLEIGQGVDHLAAAGLARIRLDSISHGGEIAPAIQRARDAGDPYRAVFLDIGMSCDDDDLTLARRVRAIDPEITIVVVSDESQPLSGLIDAVAGPPDQLYHLAKPFSPGEIRRFAQALASKWAMEDRLNQANQALLEKFHSLERAHAQLLASEARARHMALHDQLTKLPNRQGFRDALASALAAGGVGATVMFIDLDHFKRVNDFLGHRAGDELICRLGRRMVELLPDDALLARLGGDEFGVVMRGADQARATQIATRLVELCGQEMEILGSKVSVGASVGIALSGAECGDSLECLRRADLALYAAKAAGRGNWQLFEPFLDEKARLRAAVDAGLRRAIDADELRLVYQPIVSATDAEPIGYEALLRWTDPVLGEMSPSVFVPIAEETGLIMKLGEWVIERAVSDCAAWPEGMVSINLSTRHFQSRGLIPFIRNVAAKVGLPLNRIQLEITETALFDDSPRAANTIRQLRALGMRIALDDFGTGYSSLVNLRDFQIDCVKIDRTFVAGLATDYQASAIVISVTGLARALGLSVVAEGVETSEQIQTLRMLGCEMMQGFFYSKAVSASELPYRGADWDVVPAARRSGAGR